MFSTVTRTMFSIASRVKKPWWLVMILIHNAGLLEFIVLPDIIRHDLAAEAEENFRHGPADLAGPDDPDGLAG